MHRIGLDTYDEHPKEMLSYLKNYGFHFNRKACDYAVSMMRCKNGGSGGVERLKPMSKEELEDLLKRAGVVLENDTLYDSVYVANMCKADYYKSSVPDDAHLARYVKDTIDDVDQCDGAIFNRWYADMCHAGIPIEWSDLL